MASYLLDKLDKLILQSVPFSQKVQSVSKHFDLTFFLKTSLAAQIEIILQTIRQLDVFSVLGQLYASLPLDLTANCPHRLPAK